jgi:hypothetical protein
MKTPVRPSRIRPSGDSDLLFAAVVCFVFFAAIAGLFWFIACAY